MPYNGMAETFREVAALARGPGSSGCVPAETGRGEARDSFSCLFISALKPAALARLCEVARGVHGPRPAADAGASAAGGGVQRQDRVPTHQIPDKAVRAQESLAAEPLAAEPFSFVCTAEFTSCALDAPSFDHGKVLLFSPSLSTASDVPQHVCMPVPRQGRAPACEVEDSAVEPVRGQ